MRRAAIGFVILVILVFAGLLVAPLLVDLNRFKTPLAAELGARLRRDVALVGPIGLSLLPTPTITARDIRIANPPGAALPDMVRLRALEVKLAFWPLVAGRVDVRSAVFIDPEIDLERLPDGHGNWQARSEPAGPSPAGSDKIAAAGHGFVVAIDHISVHDGAVTFRAPGVVERFEHINATVTLEDLLGPYRASGGLVARGAAIEFETRLGRVDAAELPVEMTVTTRPSARLRLEARLATDASGDRRLAGKIGITADDLRTVVTTLSRTPAPVLLARPIAVEGELGGSLRSVTLEHAKVDFGLAHADGSAKLTLGAPTALTIGLTVKSLDLDRWNASRKAEIGPRLRLIAPAYAAPDQTQRARGSWLLLPQNIDASLDLAIDTVLWRGDLVRDVHMAARLAGGRLTLDRAAATLPGAAAVAASGNGVVLADGPHAEGAVEGRIDDLRGLLGFAGIRVDTVPADRLRKASLAGRFALAGDQLDLSALDMTIDATRLSGAATVLLRARPGIGLRLAADRWNLDAYLPRRVADSELPNGPAPAASAKSTAPLLESFDANFDTHVDSVTWRGQPLGDVRLVGTWQNTEATIRELSIGDVGGASGKLSGVFEGVVEGTPKGQLAFDMRGPEFERVLRVFSPSYAAGRPYGAFTVGGGLQAEAGRLALDADLEMLDGTAHLAGSLATATGVVDLAVDVEHPAFVKLTRVFIPGYRPGADLGAMRLAAHLSGGGDRFAVKSLSLAIGDSALDGNFDIALDAPRPHIAAELRVGNWPLERLLGTGDQAALGADPRPTGPVTGAVLARTDAEPAAGSLPWSSEPLSLGWMTWADVDLTLTGHSISYGGWRIEQPALAATLDGGKLTMKQLAGSFFGGTIAANGEFSRTPMPALRGAVTVRDADLKALFSDTAGLGSIEGHFDLDGRVAGSGGSAAEVAAHLSGEATLGGHDGTISGIDLKAASDRFRDLGHPADLLALLRSGAGGRTGYSRCDGSFRIRDGVARSDDLRLVAAGGEAQGTAIIDLSNWTVSSRTEFRLADAGAAPPLVMRLDGSLDQPRRVFDVKALEDFLSKRIADKNGHVP